MAWYDQFKNNTKDVDIKLDAETESKTPKLRYSVQTGKFSFDYTVPTTGEEVELTFRTCYALIIAATPVMKYFTIPAASDDKQDITFAIPAGSDKQPNTYFGTHTATGHKVYEDVSTFSKALPVKMQQTNMIKYKLSLEIPSATYASKDENGDTVDVTVTGLTFDNVLFTIYGQQQVETIHAKEKATAFSQARAFLNKLQADNIYVPWYGAVYKFYCGEQYVNSYKDKDTGKIVKSTYNALGISFMPKVEPNATLLANLTAEVEYTKEDGSTETITQGRAWLREQQQYIKDNFTLKFMTKQMVIATDVYQLEYVDNSIKAISNQEKVITDDTFE